MNEAELVCNLCEYYKTNARVLPWRFTKDPYSIWVSEIMLQQTRVEAVKPYYERFMKRLPTVKALAECPEDELLKLWEGLGYYSRVRNLNAGAKQVMEEFAGVIPGTRAELLKIKGIGPYTAGAISSLAFHQPEPAVDGNVLRVVMRLYGYDYDISKDSTKKLVEQIVSEWLNFQDVDPGILNQALMELGAMVCVPNGAPHCKECPWKEACITCANGDWETIPIKSGKKPRRIENKTVFVLQNQEGVYFHKRDESGLLAGLYEFPNVEGKLSQEEAISYLESIGYRPIRIKSIGDAKHVFSHVEWHMVGYQVLVEHIDVHNHELNHFYVDVKVAKEQMAIPSAFRTYKTYIGIDV